MSDPKHTPGPWKCMNCGSDFRPRRATSKYCSRQCLWQNNGGKNRKPICWWKNAKGYIEGRVWVTPTKQIRVKQHRYIMAGIIGRELHPWEDVHHIDGVKSNNSPSNLVLISHGDHTRITNTEREYSRGYTLNLSVHEREARSLRAISSDLSTRGRAAIAKAKGGAK